MVIMLNLHTTYTPYIRLLNYYLMCTSSIRLGDFERFKKNYTWLLYYLFLINEIILDGSQSITIL